MATFADRLKELRQENNLTQAELADKLKIGRSALAMYESGKRIPKYKTIDMFADFFQVSADYMRGKATSKNGTVLSPEQQQDWFERIKEEAKKEGHPVPDFIHTLPELSAFIEESKLGSIIESQRAIIDKLATMNEQLKKQQSSAEPDQPNGYYTNAETARLAEEFRRNPDLQLLFSAASDATPEELKRAAKYIKFLKTERMDDDE